MATRINERIPARILRPAEGAATPQPYLDLKAQRFMGVLKHPVARSEMQRKFGVDQRACKVVAEWCAQGDDHPVRAGDLLELAGNSYRILGAKPYPGCYLELYVEDV